MYINKVIETEKIIICNNNIEFNNLNLEYHYQHILFENIEYKQCSICKNKFTLNCFHIDKTNNDGLNTKCKKCYNIIQKENKIKRNNPDYKKIENNVNYKLCAECNEWLEINNFSKNNRSNDKLDIYCRKCKKIYNSRREFLKVDSTNFNLIHNTIWTLNNLPPLPTYYYFHANIDGLEHKCCQKCKKWLLLEWFTYNSKVKDKLSDHCKNCKKESWIITKEEKRKQFIKLVEDLVFKDYVYNEKDVYFMYIFYNSEFNIFKLGITNDIMYRFSHIKCTLKSDLSILHVFYNNKLNITLMEDYIHRKFKNYSYSQEHWTNEIGKTEWYNYEYYPLILEKIKEKEILEIDKNSPIFN